MSSPDYGTVLVPLSQGSMTIREKKLMINKFLEVCRVYTCEMS